MPAAFTLFSELKFENGAFERSLKAGETRLKETAGELTKVEQKSKSLGDTSATVARRYEKLNETIGANSARLHEAAGAYVKGEINAKKYASVLAQVERQTASLNSRIKDANARTSEIGQTGRTHFQNQIAGATGEISNLAAIFTGNRLSGATTEISALGGAMAAIPGPAGLAIGGIAALGTVSVGAGIALFDIAKKAADFGSKIHDAAQETGLSAETISSLKFAADNSGSSLENITKSLTKFEKTVGEAAAGSSQAASKLQELGVRPQAALDNLDGALDAVFKAIAAAPPGVEQARLAFDAFGKAGADMIPVILQAGGSVEKYREQMEALGVTLSGREADAADEFGDLLGKVGAQAEVAAAKFGLGLAPALGQVAERFSEFLVNNRNEWDEWGRNVGNVITGIQGLLGQMPEPGKTGGFDFNAFLKSTSPAYLALSSAGEFIGGPDPNDKLFQAQNKKLLDRARKNTARLAAKMAGLDYDEETGKTSEPKVDEKAAREFRNEQVWASAAKHFKEWQDAEKANAEQRKKIVEESIKQAKAYAEAVKQAQKSVADAQKQVLTDYTQTLNNRVAAVDLRARAAVLSGQSVGDTVQAKLDALGAGYRLSAPWLDRNGNPIPSKIDPDAEAKRAIRDRAIIAATNGIDPSQLTYDQKQIAIGANKREAERLEAAKTEGIDALKANTAALEALLKQGGIQVRIQNDAPDKASVTRQPSRAATNARY